MRLQHEATNKIAFIQFLNSVAEHPVYVIAIINIQKRALWKPGYHMRITRSIVLQIIFQRRNCTWNIREWSYFINPH